MVWGEIIFGWLLVVVLVGLSVRFGRQQIQSLRRLRQTPDLPSDEMRYEYRKAWRRLISCGLLLVLAVLLAGQATFTPRPTQQLADERADFEPGKAPGFTDEQKVLLRVVYGTWIGVLLVLLLVLVLAAVDLLSTRRYALRQYRKLQTDRRAMIERQVNLMRRDRNGHL